MEKNQKKNKTPRVMEKKTEKRKRFNFLKLLLKVVFSLILIFIIVFCVCFGYYFVKGDYNVKTAIIQTLDRVTLKPDEITVLVLGISTDLSTQLADTIMVCSYNPDNRGGIYFINS